MCVAKVKPVRLDHPLVGGYRKVICTKLKMGNTEFIVSQALLVSLLLDETLMNSLNLY